ncbi:MAG: MOSC domain-containing protein [Methylobacterium sp.]|uniref:MOSC domain-containing protein n=1 Tax=Methylobacterium sp. TaxID=409 RepID=UPI0025F16B1A|nr:MOSC domain-containing protein [Methylobacterium sp.]MBX9933104.1 MOSC domain-containing protein [Methylobacterium sp.]
MNQDDTVDAGPAMLDAFTHPAGSIAVSVPGGATAWNGTLLHIHVAPSASYEMEEVHEATCVAGRGIVGDRYFSGTGTYSPKPDVREVTLIEQEALDALSRNDPPLQGGSIQLLPVDHRRNLTVRGVPLNHLVGRRFRVGEVILRGGRLNFPCKYLEELLGLPVYLPLYNRSGLNCSIERGGVIRPGDAISLLEGNTD